MGIIKNIFIDHWDRFVKNNPKMIRESVINEVEKMINCGNIENGCTVYKCPDCETELLVPFTCKSRFCSSCGKLYRDKWAEKLESRLLYGPHKHLVFTIPKELRVYFRSNRKLLKNMSDIAAKVIKETIYEMNKKEKYETGLINVIHTFGRDLKWNPHVHVIMSLKCLGETSDRRISYLSYAKLRKFWQKELLDLIKKNFKTKEIRPLINELYRKKNNGFYVYAKGEITDIKIISKYLAKYAGRPAIAESRIVEYNGKTVKYKYTPHGSKKEIEEEVSVDEFIRRLIIHIPEKNFKMVRNYGIYSRNNVCSRRIQIKVRNKERYERIKKLKTWQYRLMLDHNRNPLKCDCGALMEKHDIVIPGRKKNEEGYGLERQNAG